MADSSPAETAAPTTPMLVDRFGRVVDYVRISVTDRCDFRCVYCMSEDMTFVPRAQILTLEEIAELGTAFTELGVKKIRITGGEPLVRRNVLKLMQQLGSLPGLRELVLTTNGSQLATMAGDLVAAGVKRINVSLDSLRADRFRAITRVGELERVLAGIEAARGAGFKRIKINSVILRGRNDDELFDLVDFVRERGLDISFIEEMPLGEVDGRSRFESYISSDELLERLRTRYTLHETEEQTGGPSRYFRLDGEESRIGFISPHSHNFCDTCNRVRVTAEGRLLLCLGQEHSADLRAVMRAHPGDRTRLKAAIVAAMDLKPRGHDFDLQEKPVIFRHMSVTGG